MESPTGYPEVGLGGQPEIDFLILADRAEAINGKLYMMGGGWDRLAIPDFDQPVSFSLAVGVLVPWNLTNQQHPVRIWIEHEDGTQVGSEVHASVTMGRPPAAVPGQAFRALISIHVTLKLPRAGTYSVKGAVADREPKRTVFHAVQAPPSAARPPS